MGYYESLKAVLDDGEEYSNNCIDGRCSNCGECCADLLPLTQKELQRLKDYAKKHRLREHRQAPFFDLSATDLTCPFRNQAERRCDVYEVRPLICRSFICTKLLQQAQKDRDLIHASSGMRVYSIRYEVFGNSEVLRLLAAVMRTAAEK